MKEHAKWVQKQSKYLTVAAGSRDFLWASFWNPDPIPPLKFQASNCEILITDGQFYGRRRQK